MADVRLMLALREAEGADSRRIWEWRNDVTTRAVSADTDVVEWASHLDWFARVIADPRRHLLVAEVDQEPMGVVRFDSAGDDGEWVVSINLAPQARGRRLASSVLIAGGAWLVARSRVQRVIADIRSDNVVSIRSFESAGYALTGGSQGWVRYVRTEHGIKYDAGTYPPKTKESA